MLLPELQISLCLDVFWGYSLEEEYVAASRRFKRPPYEIYSDYRDYVRSLFNDQSRFEVLGYVPSTDNPQDLARFGDIEKLKQMGEPAYGNYVNNYLQTPPNSRSFYIAVKVKDTDGKSICRWVLDVRISDHYDQFNNKITEPESAKRKYNHFKDAYNEDVSDAVLIPLRFSLNYRVRQDTSDAEYKWNISNLNNKENNITDRKGSLETVKIDTTNYIDNLWRFCNNEASTITKFLGIDNTGNIVTIQSSIVISNDADSDIQTIKSDISGALNARNDFLVSHGFVFDLQDYRWYCLYLEQEDNCIVGVRIVNNHQDNFYVECEFDIDEYFDDLEAQNEILDEVCIQIFDEYGMA